MTFVRIITLFLTLALGGGTVAAFSRPGGGTAETSAASVVSLVDINHASIAELKTLPGVGDAYSLAIVKHRPYRNKTQLRSKGVIPPAAYERIKDQIIAKR